MAIKAESIQHCWAHCLDPDRRAHSSDRWKKTRKALYDAMVRGAEMSALLDENHLEGENESDKEENTDEEEEEGGEGNVKSAVASSGQNHGKGLRREVELEEGDEANDDNGDEHLKGVEEEEEGEDGGKEGLPRLEKREERQESPITQ